MVKDPIGTAAEAPDVATDVPVGPGGTIPEEQGKPRPGVLGDKPDRPESPGKNPGSNPDNPGDDPGVRQPLKHPDVTADSESSDAGERGGKT